MKKKTKKKIEFKTIFWIGLLVMALGIAILFKLLVPMALSIIYMFIALLKLYTLLDKTGKFFGGCFFLVVFWYMYIAFFRIMMILFDYGYKKMYEGLKL